MVLKNKQNPCRLIISITYKIIVTRCVKYSDIISNVLLLSIFFTHPKSADYVIVNAESIALKY